MTHSDSSVDNLLRQLSSLSYMPDDDCLKELLPYLKPFQGQQAVILARATGYVEAIRTAKPHLGFESLLQEYGLNSREGLAILHLAEALLRIPDTDTTDALIKENINGIEWKKQKGTQQYSRLMGNTRLGLSLVQRLFHVGGGNVLLSKLFSKASEPLIRRVFRRIIRLIGGLFVLGKTINSALHNATPYLRKGYLFSYDILGEGARSQAQADNYIQHYMEAIQAIGEKSDTTTPLHKRSGISVKLSALHPRFELLKYNRMMEELLPILKMLCMEAKIQGVMLTIDAEEAARLDITLALFTALLNDSDLDSFDGIGIAIQAYQKRALPTLECLQQLAKQTNHRIPVRLVKGAYWDTEIKRAQTLGLEDFPVFIRKEHTDVSYLACATYLLQYSTCFYPQFATHNALTVASIRHIAKGCEYEFQRLYGMGEQLYDYLLTRGDTQCRIYAPVGPHAELLAYLIRRLLENGASTSFVRQIADHALPLEALLQDPITATFSPEIRIPEAISLPSELYGIERKNSAGQDTGNRHQMYALHNQLHALQNSVWFATPLISGQTCKGETIPLYQPSNHKIQVGEITLATRDHVEQAMIAAQKAFPAWSNVPVTRRAELLDKLADSIEKNNIEFLSLCMREAGRTLADSIAEVREAVDFCRYYAAQAQKLMKNETVLPGPTGESNRTSLHARGVFVCISPWNFPLAIFTGQIAAALATGNTVIAKPANQTPLIAHRLVTLMFEVGFPKDVIHLLPGEGKVIGAALAEHNSTAGMVFTGSTEVARFINQTLAKREAPITPFIAETGGQNCMILDSSALLEQAVDDIILSAFNSAGQRCSALRVIYVQDAIADSFITLLKGAMDELKIGEPTYFSTDIGPVINASAQQSLLEHIAHMEQEATLLHTTPIDDATKEAGYFVAPHLFEIDSINILQKEIFGPILHLIRFKANHLDKVMEEINSTGYGLTLGVFSRIEARIAFIAARARVGNIYVNRSMIGATVGVQPFGGEGLSGTGPKAGGAHYLNRFCTERTISVNTAAIGGNIELLS